MGAIKITSADRWFSKCVRERANWTCERCYRKTPDDKRMGLHCSHYISRANWSTRFDPDNAFAHCYGCHQFLSSHPSDFREWVIQRIGSILHDRLVANARKTAPGLKRRMNEIAAHFRAEHRNLIATRGNMCGAIRPFVP